MGGKFDKTYVVIGKSDKKFDGIGYHRDQNRIAAQFAVIANSAFNVNFRNRSDRDQ